MKRSNWIHIDFWFKGREVTHQNNKYDVVYLEDDKKALLENFIIQILNRTKGLYRRKFNLYEPNPHLFLALELRHKTFVKYIRRALYRLKIPSFITDIYVNTWCGDDAGNGEGFLNVLNAMTDFYLYHKDNKLSHIIHCCLEFQM